MTEQRRKRANALIVELAAIEDVREDDARRETERRRASYNRRSSWFD